MQFQHSRLITWPFPAKTAFISSSTSSEADATMVATMNEFELERARRIESNRKRMAEMGLFSLSTDLARCATPEKRPTVRATTRENSIMRRREG
jgi:hypothetical protein